MHGPCHRGARSCVSTSTIFRRNILEYNDSLCTATCGIVEDQDHLLFTCAFYNQLCLLILGWLGFSTALHGSLIQHFTQFRGLEGFSNKSRLAYNLIWISILFSIWKDHNTRHFHNKMEQISSLLKKVKLQAYWWLKSYYAIFDFEHTVWRLTPLFYAFRL